MKKTEMFVTEAGSISLAITLDTGTPLIRRSKERSVIAKVCFKGENMLLL